MGILDSGISWEDVDESQQGIAGPIPEGAYMVEGIEIIERSQELDTAYSSGSEGIDIQFSVVGPSHINRRIFETFVLNPKNQAALGRLKAFCAGVGIDVNSTPLTNSTIQAAMNRPCPVKVVIQPGGSDVRVDSTKNKISAFNFKGGNQPQPQARSHNLHHRQLRLKHSRKLLHHKRDKLLTGLSHNHFCEVHEREVASLSKRQGGLADSYLLPCRSTTFCFL